MHEGALPGASRRSYDGEGPMGWSARIVVPFTVLFVLLGAAVVIGILRIGGLITWPPLWLVILLFVVLLLPLALLLASAAKEADREADEEGPIWSRWGWFPF